MERVWGGRGLETKLGRSLPVDKVIGESWELVDREGEQSIVASGAEAGKSIRELMENAAESILGPGADGTQPFPVLVKWLDCQSRLSLQVHPSVDVARALGSEPKTENWYIADCDQDAALLLGLKKGVTREQFTEALQANQAESCVHRFKAEPGDSVLVESGRMHAIDAGNLILEIQQNSDSTYRVYDWGRLGLDGAPRQLHVEESLQSIDFDDFEPEALKPTPGEQVLADCQEFRIRKFELSPEDEAMSLPTEQGARLIHVVSGALIDTVSNRALHRGTNYLQPYVTEVALKATESTTILLTDHF